MNCKQGSERLVSLEELKRLYSYDPETGVFTRLVSVGSGLAVGGVAGWLTTGQRILYRGLRINRKAYMCHRLAWFYVHGVWPDGYIDHINGDGLDNRIENLRVVTNTQNIQATRKIPKHNTSGIKGVSWCKKSKKWIAGISLNDKRRYLGSFVCKEDAARVYEEAKNRMHFV